MNYTLFIILIVTVISLIAFKDSGFFNLMLFDVNAIKSKNDYFRLFSSMLIHVNLPHLLFNMLSFYSFAELIEYKFGSNYMLFLFIMSALVGNIVSYIINFKNIQYRAAGASGGVSGVIFSSVFLVKGSVYIMFIPIAIPSWIFAIIFVLISMYGIGKTNSRIGHDAHLGGAIAGVFVTWICFPSYIEAKPYLALLLTIPTIVYILIIFMRVQKK